MELADRLRAALPLDIRTPYPSPRPQGGIPSAVLTALQKEQSGWSLVFIRRGERLADHRGQIAFPGGRAEPGDSGPLQTALRETEEEIGLPAEAVDPLGILEPMDTPTGFRIWPVVSRILRPGAVRPVPPEVAEVFRIPLEWLAAEGRWIRKTLPAESEGGERRTVFFEAFRGRVVWGATAEITLRLIDILRQGQIA
ncbi:MAG: CoA pyrophosphatase [Anaerolineales bacterium]|nr:CoA pyrophosphatase [Anaerolineales bacterium]